MMQYVINRHKSGNLASGKFTKTINTQPNLCNFS